MWTRCIENTFDLRKLISLFRHYFCVNARNTILTNISNSLHALCQGTITRYKYKITCTNPPNEPLTPCEPLIPKGSHPMVKVKSKENQNYNFTFVPIYLFFLCYVSCQIRQATGLLTSGDQSTYLILKTTEHNWGIYIKVKLIIEVYI